MKQNEISKALAFEQQGKNAEAMQAARKAAALAKATGDEVKLASALGILCRALMCSKEYLESELRLLELISVQRRLQAKNSELAESFDHLSRCYKKLGKRKLALGAAEEAIRHKDKAFGPISRQLADSKALIGCIHLEDSDGLKALPYLRCALDIYTSALGPERAESLVLACRVGLAEGLLGNFQEAEKHFAFALSGLNTALGGELQSQTRVPESLRKLLALERAAQKAIGLESEFFQLAAERYGFSME